MSHATHAIAALTPRAKLRLARLIVDHGWPPARAAERYDVSWRTAKKWADRYRDEGPDGMLDRPVLCPASAAEPDAGADPAHDRAPALEAATRPGRDRRPPQHGVLDRARGPGPLPDQPALPPRPRHGRTDPPH
ncbi:helix-turn-helix domain-containing protein [Nocardioides sp. LML1-1-1.1]